MAVIAAARGGSSPRTRGTLHEQAALVLRQRFIPAHAGNTPLSTPPRWRPAVHPRARGEHSPETVRRMYSYGSSPRTRGTPPPLQTLLGLFRFIPAHAGNTGCACLGRAGTAVHPRARGEHLAMGPTPGPWERFIPAHAGNTPRSVLAEVCKRGSSPRTRGTPSAKGRAMRMRCGSSPRTRGTHRLPAPHRGVHPVHPRARGEHLPPHRQRLDVPGSSPRTRGTHLKFSHVFK